jgi:hypothetical protein
MVKDYNQQIIFAYLDKLTVHLDQQMFGGFFFLSTISMQSYCHKVLNYTLKKYGRKLSGFKSRLYENDIVLKGDENLPALGRKTEKHYFDLIPLYFRCYSYLIDFFFSFCSLVLR